jgi:GTP 3',8-cyclase
MTMAISLPLLEPGISKTTRNAVRGQIEARLGHARATLAEAIRERDLYFRISVVGACNLSCTFCHNEGAPKTGKIKLDVVERAIVAAKQVGFDRVQFTGGEPLLRPDIGDFVRVARAHVDDVGVTTNGTYLPVRLDGLVAGGLTRLHVSLQTEPLIDAGKPGEWGIPPWLMPTVERARGGAFNLRLNLPVPADTLGEAEAFLHLLTAQGVDVKVFSVLPEGELREGAYPLEKLEAIVERVNGAQAATPGTGSVLLRGFRPPEGIRCTSCVDRDRCKEQSHSLRLGSDLTLRPCLATRAWDSRLDERDLGGSIREAALFSLDYRW